MQVDIQALGTYRRLAHEGAEHAARSLSQMTGIDTRVDVTSIALEGGADLAEEFAERSFVGVEIGLDGALSGQTMVAFEPGAARTVADVLVGAGGEAADEAITGLARSGVKEIGNIMIGGFVDGWANHLGAGIDITPPTYLPPDDPGVVAEAGDAAGGGTVFVFESTVRATDRSFDFEIYMLPESTALLQAMVERADGGGDLVSLDKLSVFSEMTKHGTRKAAGNITEMSGIETEVDVSRLSFVPVEAIPEWTDDEPHVGTVFQLDGPPSGYLAILFDEPSARRIAEATLPMEPPDSDGFGDMEQSAIEELGNIMTSGIIDGWANVLETGIDHSPPQFVHDMGASVMTPVASRLGREQEYVFLIDSTVRTPDASVNCDIYALPEAGELAGALDDLLVEGAEDLDPAEMRADAELLF